MHLVRECENQRGRRKEEEIDEGRQMGGLIRKVWEERWREEGVGGEMEGGRGGPVEG
jgi:hypothetical protein